MALRKVLGQRLFANMKILDTHGAALPQTEPICVSWSLIGARSLAGSDESGTRPPGAAAPPPPGSPAGLTHHPPSRPKPPPAAGGLLNHPPRQARSPAPAPAASPQQQQPQQQAQAPSSVPPSQQSPPPQPASSASPDSPSQAGAGAQPASTAPSSQASSAAPSSGSGTHSDAKEESEPRSNPHPHFLHDEELKRLQPMLEEAERRQAYGGVADPNAIGSLGRRPTAWSFLFDSPTARILGMAAQPLRAAARSFVFGGLLARLQNTAERIVREEVERDFDAKEFLDGVQEAVPVFFDALAAGDSQALRRMASTKVVEAVERDRRRLHEDLQLEIRSVATTVNTAALGGANLWSPESIQGFDPEWAAEPAPGMSRSWLAVVIHLDVTLNVVYKIMAASKGGADGGKEGAPGGGGQGGEAGAQGGRLADALEGVQLSRTVRRTGSWLMARGPLPPGAVRSLDTSWKIVGWW